MPLRSLWPTLHCRRVAEVSPLLSIGWWYLSSVSPKRHCCWVSAADNSYPLDPHPDAVALYSGCTPGKRHARFFLDDRHARMKLYFALMDPMQMCPVGIGDEPKSVKRLRSGDILIETLSTIQTKSFLLAKTFLDSPVTICPHKTLNSCRGVISEPDLLTTTDAEILDSQASCRGQQTCSRWASVGHSSTDCSLEPKCINCSESHQSDSKLCSKWKLEKKIQEIKKQTKVSPIQRSSKINTTTNISNICLSYQILNYNHDNPN
ncbi:uncharacterized protein TNCV_3838291 [Trichonephila clavipes]|nr:uncharacterized protein TNCV_3838291 [Trichonephila clavipes]